MTVQSLFFTQCPWGDTKSAHARDPPLDGLYIRYVRVLDTGANHGLTRRVWGAAPNPARELCPLDPVLAGRSDVVQTNNRSAWGIANAGFFDLFWNLLFCLLSIAAYRCLCADFEPLTKNIFLPPNPSNFVFEDFIFLK